MDKLNKIEPLTPRELDILQQILYGKSHNEIAESLGIRPYTVCAHKENIYKKLDCHNSVQLILTSLKLKLITASSNGLKVSRKTKNLGLLRIA